MAVSHIKESIILEEVMAIHDPDSKNFKTNTIFNFVKNILYPTMTDEEEDSNDDDEESDTEEEFDKDKDSDEEEPKAMEPPFETAEKTIHEDEESNEEEHVDKKSDDVEFDKEMELHYQIKRFSFEISLKCSDNVNPHTNVIYFMKMLSTYPWEAKLLIMLASFSLKFGEFSLVHGQEGLTSKLAILKGSKSPIVPSHIKEMVTHSIKFVLHLTKSIVELAQSSSYNSSPIIPIACYWIFTTVLAYASYFPLHPSMDSMWLLAEGTPLSSLSAKIKDIISDCRPILEKKREEDCYEALQHAFCDENFIPSSNLDVLKLVFNNVKNGGKKKRLIYDGVTGKMIGLRSLEKKSLLLLISSNLDVSKYLLRVLALLIGYCVLWIPILDCRHALWDIKHMNKQYREFLSVRNVQKSIGPGFIRFVKEKLGIGLGGEPIIVSVDHSGRIVHHNAMHMILVRGIDLCDWMSDGVETRDSIIPMLQNVLKERTLAVRDLVPDIDDKIQQTAIKMDTIMAHWLRGIENQIRNPVYTNITSQRENDLWKIDTWCTKLLIGPYRPLSELVDENAHIFLIGGNNIKWVTTFVSEVISKICFNPLWTIKMVYLGTNKKVASVIDKDKVFDVLVESSSMWFVGARLHSLFLSRIKFLDEIHCDEESDEIAQGLKLLLAYEAKGLGVDGWTMLCKGNKIVVCDLGEKMLTVVNEYDKWKESAIAKGFDQAFKDHHEMLGSTCTTSQNHHACCALKYPSNFDKVPSNVKCPQCCRNMQNFVTFTCDHGHDSSEEDDD